MPFIESPWATTNVTVGTVDEPPPTGEFSPSSWATVNVVVGSIDEETPTYAAFRWDDNLDSYIPQSIYRPDGSNYHRIA